MSSHVLGIGRQKTNFLTTKRLFQLLPVIVENIYNEILKVVDSYKN